MDWELAFFRITAPCLCVTGSPVLWNRQKPFEFYIQLLKWQITSFRNFDLSKTRSQYGVWNFYCVLTWSLLSIFSYVSFRSDPDIIGFPKQRMCPSSSILWVEEILVTTGMTVVIFKSLQNIFSSWGEIFLRDHHHFTLDEWLVIFVFFPHSACRTAFPHD